MNSMSIAFRIIVIYNGEKEEIYMKKGGILQKWMAVIIAIVLLSCYPALSYASDYRGEYGGMSDDGVMITITLGDRGKATTNIWGFPISANYKISWGKITLTTSILGVTESVQGRINGDQIEFADVVLKKGVSTRELMHDIIDDDHQMKQGSDSDNAKTDVVNSAQTMYEEAERLFSIGHYKEAIQLYDKITGEFDVEDRRAYAAECMEYCETYFEASYNSSVEGLRIDKYTGYGMEEVVIPYGVCKISSGAFTEENSSIISIVLPETIKEISKDSMTGCINLERINIPASVKKLALNGTGIRELVIPNTVEEIPDGAFMDCHSLERVIFEGNPKIKMESGFISRYGVFARCYNLHSVRLPSSIQCIPDRMFEECSNLVDISIPATVTSIGKNAFKSCMALTEIVLPERLEEIGSYAFEKCASLQQVIIPENVKVLPEDCFNQCISLNYVKLPNTIEKIEGGALGACSNLRTLTIPPKLKSIDKLAFSDVLQENKGITLYVTKGTYGHRFADENNINCSFAIEPDSEQNPFKLGNTIYLGHYEQNDDLEDGAEPVSWFVIAEEKDRVLLISSFILDCREALESDYIKHEGSTVQKWLQYEFFDKAFTKEEQERIEVIDLLSKDEVEKYMPCESMRRTIIRRHAYSNFLNVQGYDSLFDKTWWLYDTTKYNERVTVDTSGNYHQQIYSKYYGNCVGIRPILWIKKEQ